MYVTSRKLVSLFFCILGFSLSLSNLVMANESPLTVNQALKLAETNSVSLQIAQLKYENEEIAWKKAQFGTPTPLQQRSFVLTWQKAQTAYHDAQVNLITTVIDSYTDLQITTLDLHIKNLLVQEAQRNFAKQQILTEKGSVGPTEVLQAQMSLMQAESAFERANDNLIAATRSLQRLLGVETFPELNATWPLQTPAINISLNDAITAGMNSSTTIKDLENALYLQQIAREQDIATGLAPLDDIRSRNDLRLAELALMEAKANRVDTITAQFNSLMQLHKTLVLQETSFSLAQKQFEIAGKQVEAGIKTTFDLAKDEVSFMQAQLSYWSAQKSYVMAWLSFAQLLGNQIDLSEVVQHDAN